MFVYLLLRPLELETLSSGDRDLEPARARTTVCGVSGDTCVSGGGELDKGTLRMVGTKDSLESVIEK